MFKKEENYDLYDLLKNKGMKKLAFFIDKRKEEGKLLGIPNFIEKSEAPLTRPSSLQDEDFALIVKTGTETHRKFPLNDAANAWFSQQSFLLNSDKLPIACVSNTAYQIKKACEFYSLKIEKEVEEHSNYKLSDSNTIDLDDATIKEAQSAYELEQEDKGFFALKDEYPLNTRMEVATALNFFEKNSSELDLDGMASEFASNLKKGCIRNKLEIPDKVWDFTTDCSTTNSYILKTAFEERIKTLDNKEVSDEMIVSIKLAYESVLKTFGFARSSQLVDLIKEADQKIGLCTYGAILSPEQIVYEGHSFFKSSNEELSSNFSDNFKQNDVAGKGDDDDLEKSKKVKEVLSNYPDAFKGFVDDKIIQDLGSNFKVTFNGLPLIEKDKLFDVSQKFE